MLTFTTTALVGLIEQWWWPFLRVGGLLMAAPIYGTRAVPVRVRLVVALAVSSLLALVLPQPVAIDPLSASGVMASAQQLAVGVALGLAVRAVLMVVELAGQVLGMTMGLGFAVMVDPQNGNQVPVVSQFYLVLATFLFLGLDGHLLLIRVVSDSFAVLPVGGGGVTREALWRLLALAGELFGAAMLVVLPAVVAMLGVNLAFGVMSRAAPQLNIFAVGFPLMLLVGTGLMLLTLDTLVERLGGLVHRALDSALAILGG